MKGRKLVSLFVSATMSFSMFTNAFVPILAEETENEEVSEEVSQEETSEVEEIEEIAKTEEIVESEEEEEEIQTDNEGTFNDPYELSEGTTDWWLYLDEGEECFFSYQAPARNDQYVVIESIGDQDTFGWMYDVNNKLLDKDDDSGAGSNFKLKRVLHAGEKIIIGVEGYQGGRVSGAKIKVTILPGGYWNSSTSTKIQWCIEDNVLTLSGSGYMQDNQAGLTPWGYYVDQFDEIVVAEGMSELSSYSLSHLGNISKITLPSTLTQIKANAFFGTTAIDKVVYNGTKNQWKKISFANDLSYPSKYASEVKFSNETVDPNIDFEKMVIKTSRTIKAGNDTHFNVQPKDGAINLDDYSYTWYNEYGNVIYGQNTYTLNLTNVTKSANYYCIIRNIYGKEKRVDCQVNIEKLWRIEPFDTTVDPGSNAVVSVVPRGDTSNTDIYYTWYKEVNGSRSPLTNEQQAGFIVINNVTSATKLICVARDKYTNNSQEAVYNVYLTPVNKLKFNEVTVEVNPGENTILKAYFENLDNTSAQYFTNTKWYKGNTQLSEKSSWLTLKNVTSSDTYTYEYKDDYGTVQKVTFRVKVKPSWKLRTWHTEFEILPNTSILMFLPFEKEPTGNVYYEWKDQNGNTISTQAKCQSPVLNNRAYYSVWIRDDYGNAQHVDVNVSIYKRWKLESHEYNLPVIRGDHLGIGVKFETLPKDEDNIKYEWRDEEGNTFNPDWLGAWTVQQIRKSTRYTCRVYDKYGNSEVVIFNIKVNKDWSVRYSGRLLNGTLNMNMIETHVNSSEVVNVPILFTPGSNIEGLHYIWKELEQPNNVFTTPSIIVYNTMEDHVYDVTVFDDDGNSEHFYYFLYFCLKTDIQQSFNGETQTIFVQRGDNHCIIPTLTADSHYSQPREYEWSYEYANYGMVTNTDTKIETKGKECHLTNVQEDLLITCKIKVPSGSSIEQKYKIIVNDDIKIDYARTIRNIYAQKGEDVSATVYFKGDRSAQGYTYRWIGNAAIPDAGNYITSDEVLAPNDSNTIKIFNISKSCTAIFQILKDDKVIGSVPIHFIVNDMKPTTITLEDKTVPYTGDIIKIDPAKVVGSTDYISYTYYSDPECTNCVLVAKEPGVYYVRAHVGDDGVYNEAFSNVAQLTILPEETSNKILGYSLTLNSDITLNYYVKMNRNYMTDAKTKMLFTMNGKEQIVNIVDCKKTEVDGVICAVVPFKVSAKDLTSTVSAKLFNPSGTSLLTNTYSVSQYGDYVFANYSSSSREYKVMEKLLRYGYYAQVYFGYNLNKIANVNKAYDSILPSIGIDFCFEDNNPTLDYVGAKLQLKYKPTIKLFFNENANFKVDGKEVQAVKEGQYYVIIISEIDDFFHGYMITAPNFQMVYSVFEYTYLGYFGSNRNQDLRDLCASMRQYYELFQYYN